MPLHRIAKASAEGASRSALADLAAMTVPDIDRLHASPAFQELCARYSAKRCGN
jgi:hypothetical protein